MSESPKLDVVLRELEEWSRRHADGPDGFTSEDLAQHTGRGIGWAQARVREGVRSGRVVFAGHREGVRSDGHRCWQPVYRLKETTCAPSPSS